jgi:hypothetical protein
MIRTCNQLSAQCHPAPTSSSKRNTTATDEYDFEMELDEQLGLHNSPPSWDNKDDDEALDDDDLEDKEAKAQTLTQDTIAYGMELQHEFANDPRREVKRALEDTFALIAYENVGESALAPLLETAGRVPVAEELNSAILGKHPAWI